MSLLILIRNLVEILELVVKEVMGPLLHPAMKETTVVTKGMVNLQTMVLEMVVLPGAVHLVHQAMVLVGVVSLVVQEMTLRQLLLHHLLNIHRLTRTEYCMPFWKKNRLTSVMEYLKQRIDRSPIHGSLQKFGGLVDPWNQSTSKERMLT